MGASFGTPVCPSLGPPKVGLGAAASAACGYNINPKGDMRELTNIAKLTKALTMRFALSLVLVFIMRKKIPIAEDLPLVLLK